MLCKGLFLHFLQGIQTQKKVKNDCHPPGGEKRPKIQLREGSETQRDEVEFQNQAGLDVTVVWGGTSGVRYNELTLVTL